MRNRNRLAALVCLSLVLASAPPVPGASAQAPVRVILDGRELSLNPPAAIVDDRTLVPLRGVFEAMGAIPHWDGATRTVQVTRGHRYVKLQIDRRLACMDQPCIAAASLDVPARLMESRTFVPVRFISQAMGANVAWDGDRRAVIIDTNREPVIQPAPVNILTPVAGQVIRGPVPLQAAGPAGSHVHFLLLDPAAGAGPMIGAGADPAARYTFTPDPANVGMRLLVAAIRDNAGVLRYSDPIPVIIAPDPAVRVTGADYGGIVSGPITFGSELNFVATQVSFRLIDPAAGRTETLGTVGPGDTFTWYPQISHNGQKRLQATAVDRSGTSYDSEPIPILVQSGYRQFVSGISEGDVLSRPATLRVAANYGVQSVQYLLDGQALGWGTSFTWNFGPEANGKHTLGVRVTAADGMVNTLGPFNITVDTWPQVWPTGIGPNQVVTGPVTLRSSSNVPVAMYEYLLVNEATGHAVTLARTGPDEPFAWTPEQEHAGDRTLRVAARRTDGQLIFSNSIKFRVFLGHVFGPRAVVPQPEFLGLASSLAVPTYHETGMSAALQVAQAILETGWGQSSPVDKYTGLFSQNLFGIKGTGPAGSVISNTWEEYNGVAYRVDDYFRAYNSIEESWKDHGDLLLLRPWYAPYREVMTNPVLGAWALRRSGYATDSQYPVKLINIMRVNNLYELDLIAF